MITTTIRLTDTNCTYIYVVLLNSTNKNNLRPSTGRVIVYSLRERRKLILSDELDTTTRRRCDDVICTRIIVTDLYDCYFHCYYLQVTTIAMTILLLLLLYCHNSRRYFMN